MGLFDMTRRERQGTIVVLAAIALLLACTVAVRYCHEPSPELQQSEILKFESEADTSLLVVPSKPTKTHKPKKKSRKHHSPKKKQDKQPRHIEPVPQF